MFRIAKSRPWPSDIDLAMARETLAYIEGDLRRIPEFGRIAEALEKAIAEIDTVERLASPPAARAPITARFFARR